MNIHSVLYCVLVGFSISGSALAECVFPSAPEFVSAGIMPTQAEKNVATASFGQYQQQIVVYDRCLKAAVVTEITRAQSTIPPQNQLANEINADYLEKLRIASEQYQQTLSRFNGFNSGAPKIAARSAGVQPPVQQPSPTRQQSAGTTAVMSSGNTFKSACWNHNLNAAELLDCGACEEQYADMLPQLNQLAANKKQSQLNAFLGDCPKNPQQSQQMPAPANQRLNQSLSQPTSQPQPQNLSLPMQHVEVVDKHDVVKREMQIGLRAEQVKRKIAERYTQSSQMQQLRERLAAFNQPLVDSRQQFIQEGAQADERYILQAKKETDPHRIPPLEELRQAERTAAWARKCDRDEQYLSDVETGKVR